jgi:hypothetical protein
VASILIRLGISLVLALAIMLTYQLYQLLPRTWGKARIGRIVSLALWGVVVWIVAWLGTALALSFARSWWGWTPPRWAVNAINVLLILSLQVVLAVCNVAIYQWRRDARRVASQGGIQ